MYREVAVEYFTATIHRSASTVVECDNTASIEYNEPPDRSVPRIRKSDVTPRVTWIEDRNAKRDLEVIRRRGERRYSTVIIKHAR